MRVWAMLGDGHVPPPRHLHHLGDIGAMAGQILNPEP